MAVMLMVMIMMMVMVTGRCIWPESLFAFLSSCGASMGHRLSFHEHGDDDDCDGGGDGDDDDDDDGDGLVIRSVEERG